MEYSSAQMTCVVKVNTRCEKSKEKMKKILQNLTGSYSITFDGEEGTMTVTGRVNPNSLMAILEKYGKHGDLKYVKFDGEVRERRPYNYNYNYFDEHDYASYGMLNPTFPPPFPFSHNQLYEANVRFFTPPMPPPPPPMVGPLGVTPTFPPPFAPYWGMPPPSLGPRIFPR